MFPFYESMERLGLIYLAHTGFDIVFERNRIADPERIMRVHETFPELKLVTSHFGAWGDWDEAERLIVGKPIYMDISYAFEFMEEAQARRFLSAHPREYLLFGTDSPWGDQQKTLETLCKMEHDDERLELILNGNATRLLGC